MPIVSCEGEEPHALTSRRAAPYRRIRVVKSQSERSPSGFIYLVCVWQLTVLNRMNDLEKE